MVQDFVMAPILAGLCSMTNVYDGSLDLYDWALMNDALAVKAENQWRADSAAERRRGQK